MKRDIYRVTFVIIGTIIGAGFASGQEIYTFFNRYGIYGFTGIFISIFLISYIIYKILRIITSNNINNYEEFIKYIMPQKLKNNKILNYTVYSIINIFLLISFNVMVAGFATYFMQELNLSKLLGAIIIALITFITLLKSINGVIKINTYLIPFIIFLIIFLGINKIKLGVEISAVCIGNSAEWILSSILYASYNTITLIPILISLKDKIKNKKQIGTIVFFVTGIMLILLISIFLLINTFLEEIYKVEIPIVYIAFHLGNIFKYIYGIVILIAIFTTAVSSCYGFLNNINVNGKKYILYSAIICILVIFTGQISFSGLINFLYPILGFLGIIQIFFLIIR